MWVLLMLALLLAVCWPSGGTVYIVQVPAEEWQRTRRTDRLIRVGAVILVLVLILFIVTNIGNPPPPIATP